MSNYPYKRHASLEEEIAQCEKFLSEFTDEEGNATYINQLQEIANNERSSLDIYLDDLETFEQDSEFVETILNNTQRYNHTFARAADNLARLPTVTSITATIADIWKKTRSDIIREKTNRGEHVEYPHELLRNYELHIHPRKSSKPLKLREIRAQNIGSLVSVRGVVIRASDVQPKMQIQTYICVACGYEAYQTVESNEYTPLAQCPSEPCKINVKKGNLFLQIRGSKFRKYQELKLQELPTEVPEGGIPRSMTLRVFGDLTRTAKPGDIVTANGIFLPSRFTGFRAIKAGLVTDTFLDVHLLDVEKKNYHEMMLSDEDHEIVEKLAQNPQVYDQLAQSISPEIHGHENTKKALLLSMVSGVTKTFSDGMRIRGDINVLLVGDPGMAKSQLLKHIIKLAPRAVYTTGKGSSGVGLTAAVIRDQISGEMTLEGGALVLADQGICCIDEFDKMDEDDRTAIHEVLEQQTVSIAKAGITTTLNARTTVLAAANPAFGRYNKRKSINENLDMPAALLSRFDLVFVMLDKPSMDSDEELAKHITYVHRELAAPALPIDIVPPHIIRSYISRCKEIEPVVPPRLEDYIATAFVTLRKDTSIVPEHSYKPSNGNDRERFCTARSLLSILRLSQAVARVHLREEVSTHDVEEALRMMVASKSALEDDVTTTGDPITHIYDFIRTLRDTAMEDSEEGGFKYDLLKSQVTAKGYTVGDFDRCIDFYVNSNVWYLNESKTKLKFID